MMKMVVVGSEKRRGSVGGSVVVPDGSLLWNG